MNYNGWRAFDVMSTCYNSLLSRDDPTPKNERTIKFTMRWFFTNNKRWTTTPKPDPGAVVILKGKLMGHLLTTTDMPNTIISGSETDPANAAHKKEKGLLA